MFKVVKALYVQDGKVLLLLRPGNKLFPKHWELPGGKVEAGESTDNALRRELAEELSCNHINSELYINKVFLDDIANDGTAAIEFSLFLVEIDKFRCVEHVDLAMFSKKELEKIPIVSADKRLIWQCLTLLS